MTARQRKLAILALAASEILIGFASRTSHARTANNERTCEHYRDEHQGFRGAFDVTAHKAVWNGAGYDDETRQFQCAAEPGGEGLAPMRIEKVPARARK